MASPSSGAGHWRVRLLPLPHHQLALPSPVGHPWTRGPPSVTLTPGDTPPSLEKESRWRPPLVNCCFLQRRKYRRRSLCVSELGKGLGPRGIPGYHRVYRDEMATKDGEGSNTSDGPGTHEPYGNCTLSGQGSTEGGGRVVPVSHAEPSFPGLHTDPARPHSLLALSPRCVCLQGPLQGQRPLFTSPNSQGLRELCVKQTHSPTFLC